MAKLNEITLNPEYAEKWNVSPELEFYELVDEETGLRLETAHDEIFRVGGFHSKDISGNRLFCLLRQVEAMYTGEWCKKYDEAQRRHLDQRECVVNSDGKILYTKPEHSEAYIDIISDRLFSVKNGNTFDIYDAETGEVVYHSDVFWGDNLILQNRRYIFVCPRTNDWRCRYSHGQWKNLSDEILRIDKETAEITVAG